MKEFTITVCTNNESLRGGRDIDFAQLDDVCVEACDAAVDIFDQWELDNRFDPATDDGFADPDFTVTQKTNGNFADWHGGRMSGDQYFRTKGARRFGHVVVKCDDINAELPKEVADLAAAMDSALIEVLNK